MKSLITGFGLVLFTLSIMPLSAWSSSVDLTAYSLEELLEIEVTSVNRVPQKVLHTPAAVFVITSEDIRRSGATTIPDLLRMVPGVEVARIDANKWAITARGFNGRFANKLLVLMDGRTVYTPTYSGVYWDIQDTLLSDIERIEVIRGPGGSIWGANAVNGVINIITKPARETQGGLLQVRAGSEEKAFGALRFGGQPTSGIFLRGFAKGFERDNGGSASEQQSRDEWDSLRGGFRADWEPPTDHRVTLQGELYKTRAGSLRITPQLTPPYQTISSDKTVSEGGFLRAAWSWWGSETSSTKLQLAYDHFKRLHNIADENETRDILDVDFQNNFALNDRHEIIWGLGYRYNHDRIEGGATILYDPPSRDDHLFSLFAQDEVTLLEDRLYLTLGSKIEHFQRDGFEIQPNARLLWTPDSQQSLWVAVSRAVSTPSRLEKEGLILFQFPGWDPAVPLVSAGGNNSDSEEVIAFELGYRHVLTPLLSIDLATFYNRYDNLRNFETTPIPFTLPEPFPSVSGFKFLRANRIKATSYGMEAAATWQVSDKLKLLAAYSFLELEVDPPRDLPDADFSEGKSPEHQFSLRSQMNLPYHLEGDLWLRYVDDLERGSIPSYVELDARIGWSPTRNLQLALIGRNLLDSQHPEFPFESFLRNVTTEVERSFYAEMSWQF